MEKVRRTVATPDLLIRTFRFYTPKICPGNSVFRVFSLEPKAIPRAQCSGAIFVQLGDLIKLAAEEAEKDKGTERATDVCIPTFINIYLNVSYNAGTERNEIFNRGVIALSLVDVLQDRGYSVRFKVFECATVGDEEMVISFFNLKGDGEKLNIKKTYFPLCHPSFLRRLIFQLDEVTPVTHRYWGSSYGRPVGVKTIKKIIDTSPNDIIIVEPDEMSVRGYDIDSDLEVMLEFTNLQEILAKA